jgi:hypothetical protein
MIKPSVAALGLAAILAGCGSSGSGAPAPAESHAAKSGPAARPDSDHDGIPDAITVKGSLGDTLALQGSGLNKDPNDHTKTRIRVTLKGVRGPFKGYDIPSDRKLIGVDLRFVNVGRLVYENPQPQGQLTVVGGETGKQTSLIQLSGKSPCDDPSLKLAAGQAKNVCIAFEVPKADRPQSFQYVADSGYGDRGLWRLR